MKLFKILAMAAVVAATPVFANQGNIQNKAVLNQITLDAVANTSNEMGSALEMTIKEATKNNVLMVTSFKHDPAALIARENVRNEYRQAIAAE